MIASWPRPQDLAFEPELAALALLEAALAVTVQALIARNPEMLLEGALLDKSPRTVAAHLIVQRYREMADALEDYRALIPSEPALTGGDDFPF